MTTWNEQARSIFVWLAAHVTAMVVVLLLAFAAGFVVRGVVRGASPRPPHEPHAQPSAGTSREPTLWTCSMHPTVKQPKPGKCPICFMDLIPLDQGAAQEGERALAVSPAAAKLAEIRTSPVERRFVDVQVRMVGKVAYDESRLAHIAAWVSGRIDRLYVDYTGVPVKAGEHLVYLYSPDLYAAQEELLQALKVVKELRNSELKELRDTAQATVAAAREKLRLLGLTAEQIAQAERTGKAQDHVTIHAPVGGIVVHKNAVEGMYVQTGSRIYTIADLSRVWVKLDAYESDLPWVHYGQQVEFETEATPGRRFAGTVSFINPVLDDRTRTVTVRLNAENPAGLLKPGMFVRAVLRARVADDGRAIAPHLAGKWTCTMHPEVLDDGPGRCRVCQMPLVSTESLGIAGPDAEPRPPLVVPASAPLITGERALVYVQLPGTERPTFEAREIVLGPRAGDFYVVRAGQLIEGDLVVTQGNFKLDSELQIRAKASMMSATPRSGAPPPAPAKPGRFETPEPFRQQLTALLDAYLAAWRALAADKAADPKPIADALAVVDMKLLEGKAHEAWIGDQRRLQEAIGVFTRAEDITRQREAFDLLSQALPPALRRFGHLARKPIAEFRCPMAFNDRGATWLQDSDDLLNPYFGAAMLKCGVKVGRVEGRGSGVEGGGADKPGPHDH